MRLIDADELTEEIKSLTVTITGLRAGRSVLNEFMKEYRKSIIKTIDEQPTAYNADKVVELIEERKRKLAANIRLNTQEYDIEREVEYAMMPYDSCLEIVKGGGQGE